MLIVRNCNDPGRVINEQFCTQSVSHSEQASALDKTIGRASFHVATRPLFFLDKSLPVKWDMDFGWKGKLVRLVPLDVDRHLEDVYLWANNPELTRTLGFGETPVSRGFEREFIERMSKPSATDIVFAVETLEGRFVGLSGIHQIHQVDRTAVTGSYIGNPSDWGKGYGSESALIRAWYCFNVLNLRMLKSVYYEGNEPSARMNQKLGFVEYGRLPAAHYKRGEYHAEVLIYCTKEMWMAKTGGSLPSN